MIDPNTKAVIETIGATGCAVMVRRDNDENKVVDARDKETGERVAEDSGRS